MSRASIHQFYSMKVEVDWVDFNCVYCKPLLVLTYFTSAFNESWEMLIKVQNKTETS